MDGPMRPSIKSKLWELSQFVFGAKSGQGDLYRRASGLDMLPLEDRRILDFGCATGNMAPNFIDCAYVGVDIDQKLIDFARKKFAKYPGLQFVTSEEYEERFAASRWPVVLLANTGHHLSDEEFTRVVTQIRESLQPGGTLCFLDPVITGQESQLLRLLMAMDQGHFHRTAHAYQVYFRDLGFRLEWFEEIQSSGRFFPQPAGIMMRLKPVSSD
jgi:SAM-dependent methyltransferase